MTLIGSAILVALYGCVYSTESDPIAQTSSHKRSTDSPSSHRNIEAFWILRPDPQDKEVELRNTILRLEKFVSTPGLGGLHLGLSNKQLEGLNELTELYKKCTVDFVLTRVYRHRSLGDLYIANSAVDSLRHRASYEVCRKLVQFLLLKTTRGTIMAHAVPVIASCRDSRVATLVESALTQAEKPWKKVQFTVALAECGQAAALPRILRVYDEVKDKTQCYPIMDAFYRVGDKTCLPAIKDYLLRRDRFSLVKTSALNSLIKLEYSDAETKRRAMELTAKYSEDTSVQKAVRLLPAVRFLAFKPTKESHDFIERHAKRVLIAEWSDLSEAQIVTGLVCQSVLASTGKMRELQHLRRYLFCDRFVNRQRNPVNIGEEVRNRALKFIEDLTEKKFDSVESASRWVDFSERRLEWNKERGVFQLKSK